MVKANSWQGFDSGIIPSIWSEGVIVSISKKGDLATR